MNKTACQYAIIRYMPFVETGEFANVGIIIFAPKTNFFSFKLLENRYARITGFFDDIDAKMFRAVTANLNEELIRISVLFSEKKYMAKNDRSYLIFDDIVRPKESIVRFSEKRVVLAEDPRVKLEELFEYYVERNFATKAYREIVLEKDLRKLLATAHLADQFGQAKIGDGEYEVPFPFVQTSNRKPVKVIKPLNLGQKESSKILEHGGKWEFRIKELSKRNVLPHKVLFTVEGPESRGPRKKAYEQVIEMLNAQGVIVKSYQEKDAIINFAAS